MLLKDIKSIGAYVVKLQATHCPREIEVQAHTPLLIKFDNQWYERSAIGRFSIVLAKFNRVTYKWEDI